MRTPPRRPWHLTTSLLFALILLVSLLPVTAAAQDASAATVDPDLRREVAAAGDASSRALMVLQTDADVASVAGDTGAVVAELQRALDDARVRITDQIGARSGDFERIRIVNDFWIQPMLLVEFSGTGTLDAMASLSGVERIVPNFRVEVIQPDPARGDVGAAIIEDRITWGLDRIEAERVWDELGLDGSGVRVAVLDTGINNDHPDVAGKLWTDDPSDPTYPGGWMEFDGDGNLVSSEPHESMPGIAHGSHVSGTVLGGDDSGVAIGVAPGATLMNGLVIPGGGGDFAQVAAGMEWAIAPTDADGNPAGQPADVVNMSLGGDGFWQEMVEPTRNMVAADVFPSFSIGNSGDGITGSPGNVFESVGVGMTNIDDNVAPGSSGGVITPGDWPDPPAEWPDSYVKPDISAPGVNTWSITDGTGYQYLSGTSMAAPHTSGTVALMRQAAPEMTIDELFAVMAETSFFDDRHGPERPNTRFGMGRINAFEATAHVAIDSGITGTVTDAESGAPVADATVDVIDGPTVRTGEGGTYTVRLEPGTYDLEVHAFAYETATVTGVQVSEETFTSVDVPLDAAPTGAVTGTATLASSGEGIPGVEVAVSAPIDLSATTDVNGEYTIDGVPAGTYEVHADAPGLPDVDPVTVTVTGGETAVADFAFDDPAFHGIAVLGDQNGTITALLDGAGYDVTAHTWSTLSDPAEYGTIVINRPGNPGEADFLDLIAATDAAGTGLVLLDTWSTSGNGIWLAHTHLDNPPTRGTGFSSAIDHLYYEVIADHPILEGFDVGDEVVFDSTTTFKDHAWFDGYVGGGTEVIGLAGRSDTGVVGQGIAVDERATNRHALLSMHAASAFIDPGDWTDDGTDIFLNAVDWVTPEVDEDQPIFTVWDLTVDPDVVLGGEPVTITANVTNIGEVAGTYEAVLRIDGAVEDSQAVTLDPGATETVTFTVTRDELGTYTVQLGALFDSFRVRPPIVEVLAETVDGPSISGDPAPLDGAEIYIVTDDDALAHVGTTDEDGRAAFEAPDAVSEFSIVVAAEDVDDHDHSYLLSREVTIIADRTVAFSPRTFADEGAVPDSIGAQFSAVVDLDVNPVSGDHTAWTYLRPSVSSPHGFSMPSGSVVVTVDTYDVAHAHRVPEPFGRDWWYASEVITGADWRDPFGYTHAFGGPADLTMDTVLDGTEVMVDWDVTDDEGWSFDVMLEEQLGPFSGPLPPSAVLEDLTDLLRGEVPDESEIVLSLYDTAGDPLHQGTLTWDQRPFTFDLADHVDDPAAGGYTLELAVDTGPWSGVLIAEDGFVDAAPVRSIDPGTVAPGESFDVTVTFTAPGDADASVSESIAATGSDAGTESIGQGWPITDWSASHGAAYEGGGAWSWDGLAAGDDVTLSYTVASPLNVIAPSDWTISGTLEVDGSAHPIGGDDLLMVREGGAGNPGDNPGDEPGEEPGDQAPDDPPGHEDAGEGSTALTRMQGVDRIATAVAVSAAAFGTADAVVLATAFEPADALAGASLAGAQDAPMLLTTPDQVPISVLDEIARLGATRAIVLGGTSAVGDQVLADLAAQGLSTERVAGGSRFETAAAIADRLDSTEAFIAEAGSGWPDALSASSLAAELGAPVLLTGSDELHPVVAEAIAGRDVTLVGGTGALAPAVESAAGAVAASVTRVAGPDRYATSAMVAELAADRGVTGDRILVATGLNWPDALSAGPVPGTLVLVDGDDAATHSPSTFEWVTTSDLAEVWLIGGQAAISAAVEQSLR